MRTTVRFPGSLLAAAILAAVACVSPAEVPHQTITADGLQAVVGPGVVFLTMRIEPDAHMQALFEGPVVADPDGCLRLDSPDRHTVVWPHGYTFQIEGGTVGILDDRGALVGRLGDTFSLPGGEVTSLHDGLGFTQADRDLAEAHCPGRYWIVSPS